MTEQLTTTERQILQILCESITALGQPPSLRRLREAVNLASVASVHLHLENLQRKGSIHRDASRSRAIQVRCDEVAAVLQPRVPALSAAAETTTMPGSSAGVDLGGQSMASVPLVGQVAAGAPILAVPGEVEDEYLLPRDFVGRSDSLFMLRVRGDSMRDDGILDADHVVVRQQPRRERRDRRRPPRRRGGRQASLCLGCPRPTALLQFSIRTSRSPGSADPR